MSSRAEEHGGDSPDVRQVRAAKNQALFREVNERIEELKPPSTFVDFVCECTQEDCAEQVELTRDEYERLRGVSNRFAVKPGHETPEAEEVVDRSDRYVTVEKIGHGKPVAERLDPRQRSRARLRPAPEPPA